MTIDFVLMSVTGLRCAVVQGGRSPIDRVHTSDAWDIIKVLIRRDDVRDAMRIHDGQVDHITRLRRFPSAIASRMATHGCLSGCTAPAAYMGTLASIK